MLSVTSSVDTNCSWTLSTLRYVCSLMAGMNLFSYVQYIGSQTARPATGRVIAIRRPATGQVMCYSARPATDQVSQLGLPQIGSWVILGLPQFWSWVCSSATVRVFKHESGHGVIQPNSQTRVFQPNSRTVDRTPLVSRATGTRTCEVRVPYWSGHWLELFGLWKLGY